MAGLAIAAAMGCMTLPETLNQPTVESLYSDQSVPKKDADDNENDVVPENKDETIALMWKSNNSSTTTNEKELLLRILQPYNEQEDAKTKPVAIFIYNRLIAM